MHVGLMVMTYLTEITHRNEILVGLLTVTGDFVKLLIKPGPMLTANQGKPGIVKAYCES